MHVIWISFLFIFIKRIAAKQLTFAATKLGVVKLSDYTTNTTN